MYQTVSHVKQIEFMFLHVCVMFRIDISNYKCVYIFLCVIIMKQLIYLSTWFMFILHSHLHLILCTSMHIAYMKTHLRSNCVKVVHILAVYNISMSLLEVDYEVSWISIYYVILRNFFLFQNKVYLYLYQACSHVFCIMYVFLSMWPITQQH